MILQPVNKTHIASASAVAAARAGLRGALVTAPLATAAALTQVLSAAHLASHLFVLSSLRSTTAMTMVISVSARTTPQTTYSPNTYLS